MIARLKAYYQQFIYWSTTLIALLRGDNSGSYYVIGHVRSGTNWLCKVLSDYFGIPVNSPWAYALPQTSPRIFHLHRFLPGASFRKRALYIVRDGRDTCVSRYFHIISKEPAQRMAAETAMNCPMREDNVLQAFPAYLRFISRYQRSCLDWKSHVQKWKKQDYISLRYEDLLADPVAVLSPCIARLTGGEVDQERLQRAVEKNSFSNLSKREPGQEDPAHFYRKGVTGDWRNYFTQEDAKYFHEYAGQELIDSGYESSHEWVEQVPVSLSETHSQE